MNSTITTQPSPTIESPPDQESIIEFAISEVDRQTAGRYTDPDDCLICTALRNRGYNVVGVSPDMVHLSSYCDNWRIEGIGGGPDDLRVKRRILFRDVAPFYKKGIVGKVVRLRKI